MTTQLGARTAYVGQGVLLRVSVVAEDTRPEVVLPKLPDFDVTPVGRGLRALQSSAIGDMVAETVRYDAYYRLVPRKAGTLVIPSIRARLDERTGASRPLRLEARTPPLWGRPPTFLGGVGGFQLEAEAEPHTLRLGQHFELRIHLKGPAALGSVRPPSLAGFDRVPLGLRVETLEPEFVPEPPARTFRFRIRATRAGEAALPRVPVAAFDPDTRRYQTRYTRAVPVRVVDVPRFNPAEIHSGETSTEGSPRGLASWVAGLLGMALVLLGAGMTLVLRLRRRAADPRVLARRLTRDLDEAADRQVAAGRITEALTRYLQRVAGRPPGALTPPEARRGVGGITGNNAELGRHAERLIAECDRARFEGSDRDAGARDLVAEAQRLFAALEQAVVLDRTRRD